MSLGATNGILLVPLILGIVGAKIVKASLRIFSARMDSLKERLEVLGWERTKGVWIVPQAFGGAEYWPREPTGNEWLVQSITMMHSPSYHGTTQRPRT